MAKQKYYRELRIAKMRSCVLMLNDIMVLSNKTQIDLIDLTFLKKTEQRLKDYYKLLDISSKIPIKKGKMTN